MVAGLGRDGNLYYGVDGRSAAGPERGVPRQSRSARARSRTRRTPTPTRPTAVASPAGAEPQALPPVSAPTATVIRPTATPGSLSRGFLTDYSYVVGELRRILLLTVGILALLFVLWLILG